ncbi:MAG TPA: hypothetical protein ENN13_01450 [Candidatus Altiarchaeales archaeon]|nr:hypothetical protein [Candidatus Altiarchaeales archaeon]
MTHHILKYNCFKSEADFVRLMEEKFGGTLDLAGKLPKLFEFGNVETYLEGKDEKHGYWTYREDQLLEFFRKHGVKKHPHELEGNPVKNRSDELAGLIGEQGPRLGVIVTSLPHDPGTPEIIKNNYLRFQVRTR